MTYCTANAARMMPNNRDTTTLPQRYHRLFRTWFWLGWPAFVGVIAIFALMIWKPQW